LFSIALDKIVQPLRIASRRQQAITRRENCLCDFAA
jgi:hypothetical protein